MERFKKITKCFIASLMLCVIMCAPVLAAESPVNVSSDSNQENKLTIRYVTPEEFDQIIKNTELGIMPYDNLFADNVIFTLTKNSDGSAHVAFYKQGMLFDGCTLSGTIDLYTASGAWVAHYPVLEPDFKSFTSRSDDIYPIGGQFAYAVYTLTVSDGGESSTVTGTKVPK
ncbi:MAG: hypothetical protein K2N15_15710 [Lachnospiraceae bacterium]|nr:hypothetical protein [Lachnospiraceae bacterium]